MMTKTVCTGIFESEPTEYLTEFTTKKPAKMPS